MLAWIIAAVAVALVAAALEASVSEGEPGFAVGFERNRAHR